MTVPIIAVLTRSLLGSRAELGAYPKGSLSFAGVVPILRGTGPAGIVRYAHRARNLTSEGIQWTMIRMRTTLDLPEHLVETARRALGFKSKTDTIVLALTELVRRRRVEDLKGLLGRVDLEIDIPASRRRPRRA